MDISSEQLSAYVLGLLGEAEQKALEATLNEREDLQKELADLINSYYSLAEIAPQHDAPADSWQKLHERIQEDKRQQNLAAAREPKPETRAKEQFSFWSWLFKRTRVVLPYVLTVCLFGLSFFSYQWQQELTKSQQELRVIARWMANPDMRIIQLEKVDAEQAGLLCSFPDGRMLFITEQKAPANQQFVVWERKDEGFTQVGSTRYRTARFNHDSADGYLVSLERANFSGSSPSNIYYQADTPDYLALLPNQITALTKHAMDNSF